MIDVGVSFEIEVHKHAHQSIIGVDRVHVVHVVNAAHLLFDGRGHRLLDGLRVRSDIVCLNEDFGRNDFGKLRNRQPQHGDQPYDDHDDGNHHGDDRAVNEEF